MVSDKYITCGQKHRYYKSNVLKYKGSRVKPDIVLYVNECAFGLHHRILRRQCHTLYTYIRHLRQTNIVQEPESNHENVFELHQSDVRSTKASNHECRYENCLWYGSDTKISKEMDGSVTDTNQKNIESLSRCHPKRHRQVCRKKNVMYATLINVHPLAVDVWIQSLYKQSYSSTTWLDDTQVLDHILRLCQWFCIQPSLMMTSWMRLSHLCTVIDTQWMNRILACTRLRLPFRSKHFLLQQWLDRFRILTRERSNRDQIAHASIPWHRFAAIEDVNLIISLVQVILHHLPYIRIYHQLVFMMTLWLQWTFHTSAERYSLLDIHHALRTHNTSWEPIIHVTPVCIHGIDAYVVPTTLCHLGPVGMFQVRFEVGKEFYMQWRIVTTHPITSTIVIRGQLSIEYVLSDGSINTLSKEIRTPTIGTWQDLVPSKQDSVSVQSATISGQFHVWSHQWCLVYLDLLVVTLFYQVPVDAPLHLRLHTIVNYMKTIPIDTLVIVLQSDRLRVPEGETMVCRVLELFLLDMKMEIDSMYRLLNCVRWCYVDLDPMMNLVATFQHVFDVYSLISSQLEQTLSLPRRPAWGVESNVSFYAHPTTTLIEFQMEAGDRSLTPQGDKDKRLQDLDREEL